MTASRALRIDDLAAVPVLSDPQLSPDARLVAYVVTTIDVDGDAYTSAIWWASSDGSLAPRQVTAGHGDASPRWSPDGRLLAFVATSAEGASQLFVLAVDSIEPRPLVSFTTGISDPQWSPDGRNIAFTTATSMAGEGAPAHAPVVVESLRYKADGEGLLGDRRAHIFIVDAVSGSTRQVTSGDFSASGVRWSPGGDALAYAATVGENRDLGATSTVFVIPAAGGEAVGVTPPGSLLSAPTWFPDGQRLLVCGQEQLAAGHNRLFVVPRAGGTPKLVAEVDRNVMLGSPGYPGARPVVLPDARILLMVRDRGCTHLYAAEPDASPACLIADPGRSLSGLSVAGGRLAYLMSDSDTNGELFVAALDGTCRRQLTRHFSESLSDVTLEKAQPRVFAAPDGTTIEGWVLRATETSGASPLLLDIHGGPHNAWGPTFDGVHLYHQALVARGWTVLLVNPRGSDGYGEDFYSAVSGSWGLSDEGDFLAPVDTLVDEGLVDARRVVVTGYSYGGYMSCWLSARHPERWAAAIPGGVVTDLAHMTATADIGTVLGPLEFGGLPWDAPERVGALPWDGPEQLRASSPLSYVRRVTAPTLLLQGERDDRCPISQAEMWFAALRTRQVPVTFVRYPEASHLFILSGRPSHRQDWCNRIVDFASQHVGDLPSAGVAEELGP